MNFISKKYHVWKLNKMQKAVNKQYEANGFNDDILKKQLEINKKRNKLDIPDKKFTNDEGFVQ